MSSFFNDRNLPNLFWSGWRPKTDMKDIEVKTIYNEGMLLSDFGHYESELRKDEVIQAPNIKREKGMFQSSLAMRANLITSLKGFGLMGVNVEVEPTSRKGIHVITDMIQIKKYEIKEFLSF
jgi:hypothetical protein